jgi:hypothetical protein
MTTPTNSLRLSESTQVYNYVDSIIMCRFISCRSTQDFSQIYRSLCMETVKCSTAKRAVKNT